MPLPRPGRQGRRPLPRAKPTAVAWVVAAALIVAAPAGLLATPRPQSTRLGAVGVNIDGDERCGALQDAIAKSRRGLPLRAADLRFGCWLPPLALVQLSFRARDASRTQRSAAGDPAVRATTRRSLAARGAFALTVAGAWAGLRLGARVPALTAGGHAAAVGYGAAVSLPTLAGFGLGVWGVRTASASTPGSRAVPAREVAARDVPDASLTRVVEGSVEELGASPSGVAEVPEAAPSAAASSRDEGPLGAPPDASPPAPDPGPPQPRVCRAAVADLDVGDFASVPADAAPAIDADTHCFVSAATLRRIEGLGVPRLGVRTMERVDGWRRAELLLSGLGAGVATGVWLAANDGVVGGERTLTSGAVFGVLGLLLTSGSLVTVDDDAGWVAQTQALTLWLAAFGGLLGQGWRQRAPGAVRSTVLGATFGVLGHAFARAASPTTVATQDGVAQISSGGLYGLSFTWFGAQAYGLRAPRSLLVVSVAGMTAGLLGGAHWRRLWPLDRADTALLDTFALGGGIIGASAALGVRGVAVTGRDLAIAAAVGMGAGIAGGAWLRPSLARSAATLRPTLLEGGGTEAVPGLALAGEF